MLFLSFIHRQLNELASAICPNLTLMRHAVFLGAPSPSTTLSDDGILYQWHTLESAAYPASKVTVIDLFSGYPSSALDGASRRISTMYENIIFADNDEDEGDTQTVEEELIGDGQGGEAKLSCHRCGSSHSPDRTTLITWAATTQPECETDSARRIALRASTASCAAASSWQNNPETQEDGHSANSYTYAYSSTSSIARFPDFHFSLGTLSALASARGKACLLLAVLEVDGPDEVTLRRGPDAGRVVSVLRLIVGDEASTIRKLTAWREIAESWGGTTQDTVGVGVRRGDVVYFESAPPCPVPPHPRMRTCMRLTSISAIDVLVAPADGSSNDGAPTHVITASPNFRSRAEICYRTMPRASMPADMRLRPDLRLSGSDASVRRVAAVAAWFERMAGLGSGP